MNDGINIWSTNGAVTDNQLWKIGNTQTAMKRAILRVKRKIE